MKAKKSVKQIAEKWQISERQVRDFCENGRIGRLILFKECLRLGIVPFIIDDDLKLFYYRGLKNWPREKGYLRDTCLSAQDQFKTYLDYFEIPY